MFQRWVGVWVGSREGRRRDGVFGVCGEEVMGVGIVLWMLRIRDRGGRKWIWIWISETEWRRGGRNEMIHRLLTSC